jgi:hypothetical protein
LGRRRFREVSKGLRSCFSGGGAARARELFFGRGRGEGSASFLLEVVKHKIGGREAVLDEIGPAMNFFYCSPEGLFN